MHRNPLAIGLIVAFAHSRPGGLDRCNGIGEIVGIDPIHGGYLVQDAESVHPVDLDDGDTIRAAETPEVVGYLLSKAERIMDSELGAGHFEKMLAQRHGPGANGLKNQLDVKPLRFRLPEDGVTQLKTASEAAADAATVGDLRADTARIHGNLVEGQIRREREAQQAVPDVCVVLDEIMPFVRGLHAPPELLTLPLGRYRLVKVD